MDGYQETPFNLHPADVTVSNKQAQSSRIPTQYYIDLTFNKESEVAFISYFSFQNFFCHAITVK